MFGDRRLGGDDQTRDRRGVLEGRPDDLGRIDNSKLDQVAILAGLRIVAVVIFLDLSSASAPTIFYGDAPVSFRRWRRRKDRSTCLSFDEHRGVMRAY